MASKKYLLLAGFMALFSTSALQAQDSGGGMYRGGGYDFNDTTLIPENRLPQHRDFMNNQYDFPAKPRNQWEIGISGGLLNVFGDVTSKTIATAKNPINTLGFAVHVRKAWGYVVSTRLQFMHGSASGFNYQSGNGYMSHNNPWAGLGYNSAVYYNYKTSISDLSLQAVFALNNIRFHKERNNVSWYVLAGLGGMSYHTMVDALDGSGARYNFNSITNYAGSPYENRKTINSNLKTLFDGDYESEAESHNTAKKNGNATLRGNATAGVGIQFRLGKSVSLSLEDRLIYSGDDLIDGQRWQENSAWPGTSSMTSNNDNINYFSIGLNFNVGGNAVAPLWWVNPLDYAYHAIKNITPKQSKCEFDADGDGISDCFDRCPNTPAGVSVDSHGCPFDTDGDGVPDYKDKQLITPTECQPVDADGVGRCPDPACCNTPKPPVGCNMVSSGTITFGSGSAKLSAGAMSQLNGLANSLRSNPNCKAVISGNGSGSKIEQQRSWDRVNSVINYMVDKQGIDRDRFIFQYGAGMGDANSVDYRAAGPGEEGPSNTPPPFPNLRK